MDKLSGTTLSYLQEDYNGYDTYPQEIIKALISDQWKPEDVNSWIRCSDGHSEKALSLLIKKEENNTVQY